MDDQLKSCKHRAIEERIEVLTTGLSNGSTPEILGNHLVQNGFMASQSMTNKLDQGDAYSKVQRLLTAVVAIVKGASTAEASAERFGSFVRIIREEMQLEDLGQQLLDKCADLEKQSVKSSKQVTEVDSVCSTSQPPGASASDTASQETEYLTKEKAEQKCKELQDTFICLVKQTKKHLKSSREDISDFCDDFLTRISSSKVDENVRFFQDNADRISSAKTFDALFIHLNMFWNYLNFGLLECIIKVKGDGELKQKIVRYSTDADDFQRRTKLHVFWEMDPDLHVSLCEKPPSDFETIVTELSIKPESTLKDLDNIRLEVADEFCLPIFAIMVSKVRKGSVVVTWFVHNSAVSLLVCGLTKELLEKLHIVNMTIVEDDSLTTAKRKTLSLSATQEPSSGHIAIEVKPHEATEEMDVSRRPQLQGGYDCQFAEPPRELQYECVVCQNVLCDPCHLDCECGIKFCRTCITPIFEQNKPCPHCNRPFNSLTPDRSLERNLGQREVFYYNKKLGREWRGKLKDADLYGIRCKHCKNIFKSSEVQNHEEKCGHRPYSCDFCLQYQSTCLDVTVNHGPMCPCRPVPCPNECGDSPERQNLDDHIAKDCPLTEVDCDFHYAGCEVRLPRKDMPDHQAKDIVTHMSLQAAQYKKEISRENEQVEQLRRQLVQLEDQIPATITCSDRQQQVHDQMEQRMDNIESRVPSRRDHISRLEWKKRARKSFFCQVLMGVFLMLVSLVLMPTIVDEEKLREKLHLADLDDQFFMRDFNEYNESRTPWFSPPFYKNGYKMYLRVGTDKGTGTHVSVFVHLMRGEFDDFLKWPFRGNITIQLLNQRGEEGHHEHTIHFTDKTPDIYMYAGINRERADHGWGLMKFISHSELKLSYLKDDCLRFRIKSANVTAHQNELQKHLEELHAPENTLQELNDTCENTLQELQELKDNLRELQELKDNLRELQELKDTRESMMQGLEEPLQKQELQDASENILQETRDARENTLQELQELKDNLRELQELKDARESMLQELNDTTKNTLQKLEGDLKDMQELQDASENTLQKLQETNDAHENILKELQEIKDNGDNMWQEILDTRKKTQSMLQKVKDSLKDMEELKDAHENALQELQEIKDNSEDISQEILDTHENTQSTLQKVKDYVKETVELKEFADNMLQAAKDISEEINTDLDDHFFMHDFHKYNVTGTRWFSPPFHRNGYKMCLGVFRTGTHVSVSISLMQSEHDDYLKWPFRGNITVQLLNQRRRGGHLARTIHFTDETRDAVAGRVTDGERATNGKGYPHFIAHDRLKPNFLQNDQLHFRIPKV